ncbi:MAG: cache domain-containing protein [Rhodospirillales bacterium]|nr:cache domain-containing protein [Rhodospirillales bacterium]
MRTIVFIRSLVVAICLVLAPSLAWSAGDRGTADEAKAMVKKAVSLIKEMGPEKAFAQFNDKGNKEFHDRDLYVFVRNMEGNTVSHGANMGMIGNTSLALKDADGKLYNKEMIETATSKGDGWVEYKWVHPQTKKIEQKSSYVERVGDYVVGAGFYK